MDQRVAAGLEAFGRPAGIGHNGGPPLERDPDESWRLWCWRRASKRAWKTPPREIALRRLARAEQLGITYREYTLEILERGVYLAVNKEEPSGEE